MAPGNVLAVAARLLVAAAACALLSGCFHSHHRAQRGGHEAHAGHDHGGPPPWAPAHGHRRKHEAHHAHQDSHSGDVKVVFDSEHGVYVVIGFPHHYYDAGHYYRLDSGRWQVSAGFKGPWLGIEATKVPESLRHASKKPKKDKKGKKHGNPARWGD